MSWNCQLASGPAILKLGWWFSTTGLASLSYFRYNRQILWMECEDCVLCPSLTHSLLCHSLAGLNKLLLHCKSWIWYMWFGPTVGCFHIRVLGLGLWLESEFGLSRSYIFQQLQQNVAVKSRESLVVYVFSGFVLLIQTRCTTNVLVYKMPQTLAAGYRSTPLWEIQTMEVKPGRNWREHESLRTVCSGWAFQILLSCGCTWVGVGAKHDWAVDVWAWLFVMGVFCNTWHLNRVHVGSGTKLSDFYVYT